MRRSTDRILTTHVGALPAPLDVWAHPEVADDRLRESVAEVVAQQRDAGIDFINEGEHTKGGHWVEYLPTRLGDLGPPPDVPVGQFAQLRGLRGPGEVTAIDANLDPSYWRRLEDRLPEDVRWAFRLYLPTAR